MDPNFIHPLDWHRLLAGATPWIFLIEVALRALVVYAMLIVAMRLLGRRVAAQLTLMELSIVVTLAAASGVVLETPTKGLLPALAVVFVTVALQRLISRWTVSRRRVEFLATGRVVTVVEDGRLRLPEMNAALLSREKIFCRLRTGRIQHLGEVERVFAEATGAFSIVRARHPQPGLSVLPDFDTELRAAACDPQARVCATCGAGEAAPHAGGSCGYCGGSDWTAAAHRLPD